MKFKNYNVSELQNSEIETINGGIGPLAAAVCIVGGVCLGSFTVGLAVGYFTNK